ncbi:MAG: phospholipid carrier-dependent glycosyltransferase [Polyangiaceae bacterium]|nr:phospholipid carrier-dependent glycosyltransferase [Polyangiaceae bacterium]
MVRKFSGFAFLLCVLGAMWVLMTRGYRDESPTEDEWAHTLRGISFWQQKDTRLHYAHPPLGNAITGLAVGRDPNNPRLDKMEHWKDANVGLTALEYIKKDYPRAREQLFSTRRVAMGFGIALAAYIFFFCLSTFGFSTAAVALVLVAFNPTIIAQTRYVTTDGPMACMATIAVGELARYITGKSGKLGLLLMPLALSAAVLTKHSGLLLIPLFFVVVFVAVFKGVGRFAGIPRAARFRRAALHALLTGAILLVSVNALYKFNRTFLPIKEVLAATEPQYQVSQGYKQQLLEKNTPLGYLPQALPIPVPYTYVFGVACVRALNKGGFPSFFWGTPRSSGHVAYFPTVLTLKSPPSLLFLLLLGVVLARTRLPVKWGPTGEKFNSPQKSFSASAACFSSSSSPPNSTWEFATACSSCPSPPFWQVERLPLAGNTTLKTPLPKSPCWPPPAPPSSAPSPPHHSTSAISTSSPDPLKTPTTSAFTVKTGAKTEPLLPSS